MNSVAIIGAGITGLTAAFYLKRKGLAVTVYEAGGRVGGVVESLRKDGYLAEFGPNTILETSPKVSQLVRDAGLESRRLDPAPQAEARYVVRYRRPIAMPSTPLGFLTTELFSVQAKLAVLREPFVPRRRDRTEETIAEFVVRRLNQEFLDHAIDALVAGIYAGDPGKLSVTQAFPKLAKLEERYGSLIKGQILGARERKLRGEVAKDRAAKFSFDEGLQVLPDTLRERLDNAVRLNTSVLGLTRKSEGWTLTLRENGRESEAEHAAVIYAGTAYNLAELKVKIAPKAEETLTPALSHRMGEGGSSHAVGNMESGGRSQAKENSAGDRPGGDGFGMNEAQQLSLACFSEIRYPPVASVVLGFRREDVEHPCEGFGMLIPKVEGFRILGTIFSSSLFPNRAPAGHLTLTSYIGGERFPELALLPSEKLYALTCEDLRVLLGVKGKPTFQHCVLYSKAIPQYNVGYGRYREAMAEIEAKAPGLFLAGHYRDGISLSDCIVSGCNVAERVGKAL